MDDYAFFLEDQDTFPSWVAALLPGWSPTPTAGDLVERLAAHEIEAEVCESEDGDEARVRWEWGELAARRTLTSSLPMEHLARDLSDEEREAVQGASLCLQLELTLPEPVLESFITQLRILRDLAPEAIALHDIPALQWRPRSWWEQAVAGRVPPPPTCLYTIHAVAEDGDDPRRATWLHTHGLWRCGSIELEVLDVPAEDASSMAGILNRAAMLFIENGVPPAEESFAIGRDLELCWIPWERALKQLPPGELGRGEDREDHGGARGVLVVPAPKRRFRRGPVWQPPLSLLPVFEDNPLLWTSGMETRRMSALATERFPTLRRLVQRHVDAEGWRFLVKLGYVIDGQEDEEEPNSEHLWFEVHGIEGGRVDATLLNQPYGIARMTEGTRDWHAVDQLSDWTVYSPHGSFGPDRVGLLLEQLDADSE